MLERDGIGDSAEVVHHNQLAEAGMRWPLGQLPRDALDRPLVDRRQIVHQVNDIVREAHRQMLNEALRLLSLLHGPGVGRVDGREGTLRVEQHRGHATTHRDPPK